MSILVISKSKAVHHLKLEADAQAWLTKTLKAQAKVLLAGKVQAEYRPGGRPGSDELFRLTYKLPDPLAAIRRSLPKSISTYSPEQLAEADIVALVLVEHADDPVFTFQSADSRNVLKPKSAVVFGKDNFQFVKSAVLTPGKSATAVHKEGRLIFRSEHSVRHFLDLEEYFIEATDGEIERFFGNAIFSIEKIEDIKAQFNTVTRRQLAQLMSRSPTIDGTRLREAAKESGVTLDVDANGAVIVRPERAHLKEIIGLLSHHYLRSLYEPSLRFYASDIKPLTVEK